MGKKIKRDKRMGPKTGREKEREKQCASLRPPVRTQIGIIFSPPENEKSIILVNYLCLHAIQETSELFLHKEETVYKTLSKV